MNAGRLWLALAVALFGLPLFVDLGLVDMENDEAIYSFAVDRILETHDWLEPKSSPNEDYAFLEKPPLKFWLIAASIEAGVLPTTEFGLRFWDAAFGAIAFAYVFAIGCVLIGPVAGGVALLILFVHWPLLFDHGLRNNNMEAALFLSYCGGVYHFLAWAARATSAASARGHAIAVALYFFLGFMTKFVAVAFLPLVLGVAATIVPDYRRKVLAHWRVWAAAGLMVAALVVPWFAWASLEYGMFFWQTILSESVYRRFTVFLDPNHVQPWFFYLRHLYDRFGDTGSNLLVVLGLALLAVQVVRRRWPEGLVVLLWAALPLALISTGTSKLYHYAYPFLPPLALAAGYAVALVIAVAPAPVTRLLERAHAATRAILPPAAAAALVRPPVRRLLLAVAVVAGGIAVITLLSGPIRIDVDGRTLFKSSGVLRPAAIVAVFGLLGGATRQVGRWIVPLLVASLLPLQGYRDTFPRMASAKHPLRDARDCVLGIQARGESPSGGLWVDLPDEAISHPLYYYFRRVRPWTRAQAPAASELERWLDEPAQAPPVLIEDRRYRSFMGDSSAGVRRASPPMVAFNDVLLLLPGPYARCSPEAGASEPSAAR